MGLLANVSPFDFLLLLLLLHVVAIFVAMVLYGERSRATAP